MKIKFLTLTCVTKVPNDLPTTSFADLSTGAFIDERKLWLDPLILQSSAYLPALRASPTKRKALAASSRAGGALADGISVAVTLWFSWARFAQHLSLLPHYPPM